MRIFLAASILCLSGFACSKDPDTSNTKSQSDHDRDGLLVRCEQRMKSGNPVKHSELEIFIVKEPIISVAEGIALGFKGRWNEETSLGYSQGDQPAIVGFSESGRKVTFTMAKKICPGLCGNTLILTTGGGDSEESQFIEITELTLNQEKDSVRIEGTDTSSPAEPWVGNFEKCNVKKSVLKDIRALLK
ncbi:MAG TPA: hypothetical protein VE954_19470 [Oligoflexus sp.]|uniref:hypothetical protein n=1 Tax=Oligoflexus sp. TaxID=1971216 RepID=UPI002D709C7A|nr:hypothetical protein [Oligoflexus sp.]HYX35282.1 hypothetical protein [Oligoflexus sp.]